MALLLVAACDEEEPTPTLPGDDVVLAEVGGVPVTRYDLERTVAETLNEQALGQLDDEGRREALESIVATKALAAAREAEMDPQDRLALDRKVARYRERLLVESYLREHAPPQPVTEEMVRAYYDEHRDRFRTGGGREYEVLYTSRAVTEGERGRLLSQLRAADETEDWEAMAERLTGAGLPVGHRRGNQETLTLLPPRVRTLVASSPVGRAAPVAFVDGRAFVLRVTRQVPPRLRPLSEVRSTIRASLGPSVVRESIREVREQVLADTEVSYR